MFFKPIVQQGEQAKRGKKSKHCFTIIFFVSATGEKNKRTNFYLKEQNSSVFQGLNTFPAEGFSGKEPFMHLSNHIFQNQ